MSRRTTRKPLKTNGSGPKPVALEVTPLASPQRDKRALAPLDWLALALIAAVLLLAPLSAGTFVFMPVIGTFGFSFGIPLLLAFAAIAFGVVAWRERQRPVAIGAVPMLAGVVLLLGVWAILSLIPTRAPYLSLNALAVFLAAVMVGGLAARLARDPRGWAALTLTVIGAAFLVSLIGIWEYVQHWLVYDITHRTFATFVNPDFLAGYLLLTLPITLAAFAAASDFALQLALGAGLGVQSACLVLTGSRSAVGVLLLAVLVWLALAAVSRTGAGRWGRIAVGLVVLVVAMLLASTPLRARVTGVAPAQPNASHAPGSPAPGPPAAQQGPSPLAAVETTAAEQSHSAAFRRYTWSGAIRMALSNPVFGTGIGTFDVAYPRYAETAYTAHAHNSYLQWADETGLPGLILLLAVLAAASAFAAHVLLLQRSAPRTQEDSSENESETAPADPPRVIRPARPTASASPASSSPAGERPLFATPGLLLAGLLAALLASMLHSLFDSDWYIVATALTLSAVLALMVALARNLAPLATQTPRPLLREMFAVGAIAGLFLLWRAGATGLAQSAMAEGAQAMAAGDAQAALGAYRTAAGIDPLDPEPHLILARLDTSLQRPNEARDELEAAAHIAPIGKTFYRLGRFYASNDNLKRAIDAFQHAREREPHNLQNLRALAETLVKAGEIDRAAAIYREMAGQENAPYGTVRAVPTLVETDFAYAHAGLADIAYGRGQWAEAADEYARAAAVLRAYWGARHLDTSVLLIAPEKRTELDALYLQVLTRWQECLQKLGRSAEAARVAQARAAIQTQLDAEKTH